MRAVYTSQKNMAQEWRQTMSRTPGELRRAVGQNTSLVFQSRRKLMNETIYTRAPTERPLTGRLRRSEKVEMAGNVARIKNTAPYAQGRNDATGTSKSFPHDMTSDWAGRSVSGTVAQRRANVRAALRRARGAS
jgi:hypothetical protein